MSASTLFAFTIWASSRQVSYSLKKTGLLELAMLHLKIVEFSPLLQSYLRHLSRFLEKLNTLWFFHNVGLNDVKLFTDKKVISENTYRQSSVVQCALFDTGIR